MEPLTLAQCKVQRFYQLASAQKTSQRPAFASANQSITLNVHDLIEYDCVGIGGTSSCGHEYQRLARVRLQ